MIFFVDTRKISIALFSSYHNDKPTCPLLVRMTTITHQPFTAEEKITVITKHLIKSFVKLIELKVKISISITY